VLIISTARLESGMRLAKPVLNENGMVLMGEDTELTDPMIERLRRADTATVYVKGMSKPEKSLDEMLLDLNRRFEKVENEPYMPILKKALTEHIEGLYDRVLSAYDSPSLINRE
jgi:hypothetical protein